MEKTKGIGKVQMAKHNSTIKILRGGKNNTRKNNI